MDQERRETIFKKLGIKTTYERLQEDRKNGIIDDGCWHHIWNSRKEVAERKKRMREQNRIWNQQLAGVKL